MNSPLNLGAVLDSSIDDLQVLTAFHGSGADLFDDPIVFYAACIERFWRGDLSWFKKNCSMVEPLVTMHPIGDSLRSAFEMRQSLLAREPGDFLIDRAIELVKSGSPWAGELCMLIAAAYEMRREIQPARMWYSKAIIGLENLGARRKAIRAAFNVVVLEGHIDPQANLIGKYHDIYRRAMKRESREPTVAGLCLLNLSRDYQNLGATEVAIKYCERAIKILNHVYATLPFYMAIVHRCHLYLETGRLSEARADYQFAALSPFEEVKGAIRLLENAFSVSELEKNDRNLHLQASWEERKHQWTRNSGPKNPLKLSHLEQLLIRSLSQMPRTRVELIEILYGVNLSIEVRINRFQSMLSTLRKKAPGLVRFERGKYHLAERLPLGEIKSA